MTKRVLVGALVILLALSATLEAQYGWFTQNGGLIARMSSSTTAATIRQDGSGAILDLYAGTTRVFRAISTGISWAVAQTINRDGIGVTSTDGLRLQNATAAAAGAQQYSPRTCWEGQGWKTNSTAASQSVVFCAETQPVQGTSAPTGNWILKASINGGAFSTVGTFTSGGAFLSPASAVGAPSYSFASDADSGIWNNAADQIALVTGGANRWVTSSVQFRVKSDLAIGWSSGDPDLASGDTLLSRLAAGSMRLASSTDTFDTTLAAWGTTQSPEAVSVADAAVLTGPTSGAGFLIISIGTDNNVCTFALTGTSAPVEINDPGTLCSVTATTASSINVYYSSGYKIENLRGGTRALRIQFIGG